MDDMLCPICSSNSKVSLLDVIDLNKFCSHDATLNYTLSGIPIYYAICDACFFVFAKDMYKWSDNEFRNKIYNSEYINFDGDYLEIRPKSSFKFISDFFGPNLSYVNHLDYGGGSGRLSELMQMNGINSKNYEPFSDSVTLPIGKFDLITAIEVVEHVPNPIILFENINNLLSDPGIFLFGTQISDGHITKGRRLDWWYASPRNGHISLYSKKSLQIIAQKFGFYFVSLDSGIHFFTRSIPDWAKHRFSYNF